jgi:hypothetical protein
MELLGRTWAFGKDGNQWMAMVYIRVFLVVWMLKTDDFIACSCGYSSVPWAYLLKAVA